MYDYQWSSAVLTPVVTKCSNLKEDSMKGARTGTPLMDVAARNQHGIRNKQWHKSLVLLWNSSECLSKHLQLTQEQKERDPFRQYSKLHQNLYLPTCADVYRALCQLLLVRKAMIVLYETVPQIVLQGMVTVVWEGTQFEVSLSIYFIFFYQWFK